MKTFEEFVVEASKVNVEEIFNTEIRPGTGIDINKLGTIVDDETKAMLMKKLYDAGAKALYGLGKKFSSVNIDATIHQTFIEFRASGYYAGQWGKLPFSTNLRIGFTFNPKGTIIKLDKEVTGSVKCDNVSEKVVNVKMAEYKKMVKDTLKYC